MTDYRHTQWGVAILVGCAALCAVFLVTGHVLGTPRIVLPTVGLLVVVAVLFGSLTTEVNDEYLVCRFGPGLIRKRFPLRSIVRSEIVRNRWIYGWGIRYTPHGWLFNVSGLSAVELSLTNGKRIRIGTDRPDDLAQAIDERRLGRHRETA